MVAKSNTTHAALDSPNFTNLIVGWIWDQMTEPLRKLGFPVTSVTFNDSWQCDPQIARARVENRTCRVDVSSDTHNPQWLARFFVVPTGGSYTGSEPATVAQQ